MELIDLDPVILALLVGREVWQWLRRQRLRGRLTVVVGDESSEPEVEDFVDGE